MIIYTLTEVKTKRDIRRFLDFPSTLYKNDPVWIRPLDNDIEIVFDRTKNKLFDGGDAIRWLLTDASGKIVGRIAAFYNDKLAAATEQPTGGCGFFECIDSQEAANVMFDAARQWLVERGMEAMDGSVNFGDRMMWWGVLKDGFTEPIYGMNYNFGYYNDLFEAYGFLNYFDQHTFKRHLQMNALSEATYLKAERLFADPDYKFEYIVGHDIKKVAQDFRKVYNKAWANFTGVPQMSEQHANELLKTLKPIIDRKLIYFAYYKGEAVGFFVMIPDINQAIKYLNGKFGIIQKLRFMYLLKCKKVCRRIFGIIFGVASDFQGKGIESGLIRLYERTMGDPAEKLNYDYMELSWVGDFNPVMIRMVETQVNAVKYKRHITYRYLFDREKPFTRAPRLRPERTKTVVAQAADTTSSTADQV